MSSRIYTAPKGSSKPFLGRTLVSLLTEAVEKNPQQKALNQPADGEGWRSFSSQEFLRLSEETALGLMQTHLARQDRVALFMHSDVYFCVADMACMMAGLIDVPIYLTQDEDSIRFVLRHAQARALFVTDQDLFEKVKPFLGELEFTKTVIIAQSEDDQPAPDQEVLPEDISVLTLHQLRRMGQAALQEYPQAAADLRSEIDHRDVATIIYTSGTTGKPKGVMLTHENISSNALGAFSENSSLQPGNEVVLSFLPLTHVFARTLHYGYLNYGASVYFVRPSEVSQRLRQIRPTGFATVPHVLEKIYQGIMLKGSQLTGMRRKTFDWAVKLAENYDMTRFLGPIRRSKMALADKLVYSKWREALGGRVRGIISGGASLRADLVNFFGAARVPIVQGYGLTETSPVVTYNRLEANHPGTVGVPLPGVEIRLADDGEILTRGPHVMRGYYRNPQGTREVIDSEGWLHTGDIGKIRRGGYLKITDRKKSLFKLSTGKYVMPQPLERRLTSDPLVAEAVALGADRKYATALIVPNRRALAALAKSLGLDSGLPASQLQEAPAIRDRFQALVEKTNADMPSWSQIQYFRLLDQDFTPENGLLTPTLKVRRNVVYQRFADEIEALYDH